MARYWDGCVASDPGRSTVFPGRPGAGETLIADAVYRAVSALVDCAALAELRRLREEAARTGFTIALPALDAALGVADTPASVTLP